MYCIKCGKELANDEKFCPNCGTNTQATSVPGEIRINTGELKNKAVNMKENLVTGLAGLGNNKIFILSNIALLLLSLIFSFTDALRIDSAEVLGFSASESLCLLENDFMKFLYIVLYLGSVFLILSPLIFKKNWSTKFYILEKFTLYISLAWFFLCLFIAYNQIQSNEIYKAVANLNITVTGWFYLITSVSALILSYKNTSDIKKEKRNQASAQ